MHRRYTPTAGGLWGARSRLGLTLAPHIWGGPGRDMTSSSPTAEAPVTALAGTPDHLLHSAAQEWMLRWVSNARWSPDNGGLCLTQHACLSATRVCASMHG